MASDGATGTETRVRYEYGPYREIAAALCRKFPEQLQAVPPLSSICFVRDDEATPKSKGKSVLARVRKVPGWLQVLTAYEWLIEIFPANHPGEGLTREQLQILIYHELRHFSLRETKDGEEQHTLGGHDVEDFGEIAATVGIYWASPNRAVPDILAPGFRWRLPPRQGVLPLFEVVPAPGGDTAAATDPGDSH